MGNVCYNDRFFEYSWIDRIDFPSVQVDIASNQYTMCSMVCNFYFNPRFVVGGISEEMSQCCLVSAVTDGKRTT